MTYRGQVKNGVIRLDPKVKLPNGTTVSVRLLKSSPKRTRPRPKKQPPSLYEMLKPFIGIADGLPSDMARNHDHYLHGTPKR
jgi:hypothetical protein